MVAILVVILAAVLVCGSLIFHVGHAPLVERLRSARTIVLVADIVRGGPAVSRLMA